MEEDRWRINGEGKVIIIKKFKSTQPIKPNPEKSLRRQDRSINKLIKLKVKIQHVT